MSPFYRSFSDFRDCSSAYLCLQHPQVYLVNWSPYHCKAMWENHPISANIYGYSQLPIAMRSKDNIRSKIIFEMMLSRLYIQNDNYEMKSANRFWKIWKKMCFTLIRRGDSLGVWILVQQSGWDHACRCSFYRLTFAPVLFRNWAKYAHWNNLKVYKKFNSITW